MNEWASEHRLTSCIQHTVIIITGHFGDESFQAIDCTGTDKQTYNNKKTKQKPNNTTNKLN